MIFDDVRDDGEALRIAVAALRLSISHSTGTESSLYSYRDRFSDQDVAARRPSSETS